MKKLLSIVAVFFFAFSVSAQKVPEWINKRATVMSQDMKTFLSLDDAHTKIIYDEEVKKQLALLEVKKANGGKKPTKEVFREITAPFITVQTEAAGGKEQMKKYKVHAKEEREKAKANKK
ncbi:hypothetical protein [Flavicella sp.]|uniref:hypothetical protein n=1 Tax=Flavicella sp. TaxID=2957742 RepID=UPI002609D7AC|nr:hypothetical protein [Flavicella sp.]MDG1804916.1 hypothetical protein [Flavicella sp.]